MFKKIIAITLLLAFSLQSFSRNVMVIDYYSNIKSYISKCVNKSRPSLHCNGQCSLMKKMNEEDGDKGKSARTEMKSEVLSSRSYFSIPINSMFSTRGILCIAGPTYIPRVPAASIFHPPAPAF